MKNNKKNVLFIATGNSKWIGGLYYIKNILFSLIQSDEVKNGDINIHILVTEENRGLFEDLSSEKNVNLILYPKDSTSGFINKIGNKIISKFFNRIFDFNIIKLCRKYNIHNIYPTTGYPFWGVKNKCIYWIPDFQHVYLPNMFSQEEILRRDSLYGYMAKDHKKLVLSSNDAYNHYKKLYPENTKGVYVAHFLSYIQDIMVKIDEKFIAEVLDKYQLSNEFVFVPNQFWKHKNHLTLFNAMSEVVNNRGKNIQLICTGNTDDHRNKEYFDELLSYISENNLNGNIKILGFISREEQLAIMAAANLVIQPSLFEGWGTGVEDAKALGKKIIMSDLDVHHEQFNKNCIIFEKDNHKMLADIIVDNFNNENVYSYKNVLAYTEEYSKKYSKEFVKVFE